MMSFGWQFKSLHITSKFFIVIDVSLFLSFDIVDSLSILLVLMCQGLYPESFKACTISFL
nr:MAG TPA: hypothetical protein [Caudoviricetes sp.]